MSWLKNSHYEEQLIAATSKTSPPGYLQNFSSRLPPKFKLIAKFVHTNKKPNKTKCALYVSSKYLPASMSLLEWINLDKDFSILKNYRKGSNPFFIPSTLKKSMWASLSFNGSWDKDPIDLTISIVTPSHIIYCLMRDINIIPTNNRSTRKRCGIFSKLMVKLPEQRCLWRCSGVFIVNFERISHHFTLNK